MNHQTLKPNFFGRLQLTSLTESLDWLKTPHRIVDGIIFVEKSVKDFKLRKPIQVELEKVLQVNQKGLVNYIFEALTQTRPTLIPYVFENKTLIELTKYLLRYKSGSPLTLYTYVSYIQRYCNWLNTTPDNLIGDLTSSKQLSQKKLQQHINFLEDYMAQLQDEGLSPNVIANLVKAVKTLYRIHRIPLQLPYPLQRKVIYKDRAPTPEEIWKLIEIGDLREKTIVSILALSGLREGTLAKLKYYHVKEDLEKGIIPVHIHVEAEITKGKYHDYDTFIGREAVEFLKTYLEVRKRGTDHIPPETINDDSPLIRDSRFKKPKHITEKQIRQIVQNLYRKAGLLKPKRGRLYELRVHSIRKFFKTQLTALGVPTDYIEYMMGHKVSTYQDIQMKGVEFLRNIYAASGLSIKPKTKSTLIELLKTIIKAHGEDPEKILTREALTQPHRTLITQQEREEEHIKILSKTLKELLRKEVLNSV